MSDKHARITVYDYLLCDHIETCEARRLAKTRKFIRYLHSLATKDEFRTLARYYRAEVKSMIHNVVKGLAASVGEQMANGISLPPFNADKVISGIYNFNYYDTIIDAELQIIEPIDSDVYGELCFGDFIKCMEAVKHYSDYTITVYKAFEHAYWKYLRHSPEAFINLPDHEQYRFLGPWALSRDDIEPYMRMIFMIIALIVDRPDNFEPFYDYYDDSIWDYHCEKTGRLLVDRELFSSRKLARAFEDERIFELCSVLTQPQHSDILYYFRQHASETAHQLMCSKQFRDALYLAD